MFIVHLNYGSSRRSLLHLVRTPEGNGVLLTRDELMPFLKGKRWRFAR